MPVLAVKAVSMSSSAFFIEAAANTVRVLSSAVAGEEAAPHSRTKAANSPAIRCIRALHACLHAQNFARENQASVQGRNATTEALFRVIPQTYGHGDVAGGLTITGWGHGQKATLCLLFAYSDGWIAIEIESSLAPET